MLTLLGTKIIDLEHFSERILWFSHQSLDIQSLPLFCRFLIPCIWYDSIVIIHDMISLSVELKGLLSAEGLFYLGGSKSMR